MTCTKFEDIPQFTRGGSWECEFSIHSAVKWIAEEVAGPQHLDLDPDFHRVHVWTAAQQIAWLEFFLRGGETGRVIYLNNPLWTKCKKEGEYSDYTLVDGKQRVEAMRRFVYNEIRVFGSFYEQYTDKTRPHVFVRINVNDLASRAEVLQWYIDMNVGGTPHTEAEISRVRGLLESHSEVIL
jgi:hypothetical protein